MEKLSGSEYSQLIDSLAESPTFEKDGDSIFLSHKDAQARLMWTFRRPGSSHPSQLSDKDPIVAAMAFKHSRLKLLERFRLLNPAVKKTTHPLKKLVLQNELQKLKPKLGV